VIVVDDPVVRAVRARFSAISAEFGDRLDDAKKVCGEKLAAQQRVEAPVVPVVARRRRPEPDDPSDTGFFSVSWMTKR
jgi:hypothetical protein